MRTFALALAFAIAVGGATPPSSAQSWDAVARRPAAGRYAYVRTRDWMEGQRLTGTDWARSRPVDWRNRRLDRPPFGFAWREVDGKLLMARRSSGLIERVIPEGR